MLHSAISFQFSLFNLICKMLSYKFNACVTNCTLDSFHLVLFNICSKYIYTKVISNKYMKGC